MFSTEFPSFLSLQRFWIRNRGTETANYSLVSFARGHFDFITDQPFGTVIEPNGEVVVYMSFNHTYNGGMLGRKAAVMVLENAAQPEKPIVISVAATVVCKCWRGHSFAVMALTDDCSSVKCVCSWSPFYGHCFVSFKCAVSIVTVFYCGIAFLRYTEPALLQDLQHSYFMVAFCNNAVKKLPCW